MVSPEFTPPRIHTPELQNWPPELARIGIQGSVLVIIFFAFMIDDPSETVSFFLAWLLMIIMFRFAAGKGLFWQIHNISYYLIVIPGEIAFGRGLVEGGFGLEYAKVIRGVFGANSISGRFGEYTVVVPENVLSFSELKKLVKMENTKNQNEPEKIQ